VLAAFVERILNESDTLRVEQHLDACDDCRWLVVETAQSSSERDNWSGQRASVDDRQVGRDDPTVHSRGGGDRPDEGGIAADTMVDNYRIMRLLGRGGMGDVYLARDTLLGRKVAIKLVRPGLIDSAEALDWFRLEARATARFNHPNIVAIHAVGEYEARPYVALQYLEGQTLKERIAARRPGLRESLRISLAIAEALGEAHRHGVLHRDLKPANVHVGADGQVRVLDFGLANFFEASIPPSRPLSRDALVSPVAGGTPRYMAPEQWHGAASTPATDLWALGVILFELVNGRPPFDQRNLTKLRAAVCGPDPAPTLDKALLFSKRLHAMLFSCLAKSPEQRPSAEDMREVLQHALRQQTRRRNRGCPFQGLLPFDESDTPLFYGRETEIASFVERARLQPVLAVVGPSGAGKSSFVRAGVIPRLRERAPLILLRLRPGDRPFEALAAQLLDLTMADRPSYERLDLQLEESDSDRMSLSMGVDEADVAELAERLIASPHQLSLELRVIAEEQARQVILFVDQLEELFTLTADVNVQTQFMAAITTAADDALDPVRVIFAVRDDFLGRLTTGPAVERALSRVTVLQRPGPDALRAILTGPVEQVGYEYEDPTLVDDMIDAVKDELTCLPLLEFAAQMLWQRRDEERSLLLRSAYDELGGVEGALAQHADGVLDGLSPKELSLARQLLLRLVTVAGTRKVVAREQLLGGLSGEASGVLGRLREARLLAVRKDRVDPSGADFGRRLSSSKPS